MAVNVAFFDDTSLPDFGDYRGVKHDVFVLEQGWQLPLEPAAGRVAPDPSDHHSMFVIARSDGHAVGIARATMIRDSFPHAEFFTEHMKRPELRAVRVAVATVNSVAVRPAFRGKQVQVDGRVRTMTTAKALMVELTRRLDAAGAEVVLLTTSPGIAAVFFDHVGYYVIDPLFHALDRTLINMGLCVHDSEHFRAIGSPLADLDFAQGASGAERRCIAYFRERSAAILQGRSIEQLCRRELARDGSLAGTYAPAK